MSDTHTEGEAFLCDRCGYSAQVVSAESGSPLFCAVCAARENAADFKAERDEARRAMWHLKEKIELLKVVAIDIYNAASIRGLIGSALRDRFMKSIQALEDDE